MPLWLLASALLCGLLASPAARAVEEEPASEAEAEQPAEPAQHEIPAGTIGGGPERVPGAPEAGPAKGAGGRPAGRPSGARGGGHGPTAPPEVQCVPATCHPPKPPKGKRPPDPCAGLKDRLAVVRCWRDRIDPHTAAAALDVSRRVAWTLRFECAGLLLKPAGENIAAWRGRSFSVSRIAYPTGRIFKILTDAGDGGKNGAAFNDDGCVDVRRYVPATDPDLP